MNIRLAKGLALAVVVGLLILLIVKDHVRRKGDSASSTRASIVSDAQVAPSFTLPDLDGRQVSLENFKGKVVLLNFWATWCGPCRDEIPDLIQLHAEYRDKGFEVVGIALDEGGASDVKPFVEQMRINYPILIGDNKVTEAYGGIYGIPTTFIIDRQGRIVKKYIGSKRKSEFEADIRPLL